MMELPAIVFSLLPICFVMAFKQYFQSCFLLYNTGREKLRATAPVKQLSVGRPADFAAPKELLCGKRKPMHSNEKILDRPKTAR